MTTRPTTEDLYDPYVYRVAKAISDQMGSNLSDARLRCVRCEVDCTVNVLKWLIKDWNTKPMYRLAEELNINRDARVHTISCFLVICVSCGFDHAQKCNTPDQEARVFAAYLQNKGMVSGEGLILPYKSMFALVTRPTEKLITLEQLFAMNYY